MASAWHKANQDVLKEKSEVPRGSCCLEIYDLENEKPFI